MTDTILLTAGTGNIGSELTALLAHDPAVKEVRVATRNPESAAAKVVSSFNPSKVKPIAYDINQAETVAAAFKGVTKLCLITPLSEQAIDYQQKTIDAAKQVGVEFMVKVSVDTASPDASEGPGAIHWAGEEMIREASIPRVMLRPTIFMQHFHIVSALYQQGADTFYLPSCEGKIAFLDCRDIAYAAYQLLIYPEKKGRLKEDYLHMTGPKAISGMDIAEILSALRGQEVQWNQDVKAFEQQAEATGTPLFLKDLYQAGASGAFETVAIEAYAQVTGRIPTSFARFAWDYRHFFSNPLTKNT